MFEYGYNACMSLQKIFIIEVRSHTSVLRAAAAHRTGLWKDTWLAWKNFQMRHWHAICCASRSELLSPFSRPFPFPHTHTHTEPGDLAGVECRWCHFWCKAGNPLWKCRVMITGRMKAETYPWVSQPRSAFNVTYHVTYCKTELCINSGTKTSTLLMLSQYIVWVFHGWMDCR